MNRIISSCVLASALCCLAQSEDNGWLGSPEGQAAIKEVADKYGITGVTRPYRDTGQKVISDIEPILRWADATYGGGKWRPWAEAKWFGKNFRVVSGGSGRYEQVELKMYLAPSFEGAEKTAALAMSAIVIPENYSKGTFSGGTIGDWSYGDYRERSHATLRFLRRNLVV